MIAVIADEFCFFPNSCSISSVPFSVTFEVQDPFLADWTPFTFVLRDLFNRHGEHYGLLRVDWYFALCIQSLA